MVAGDVVHHDAAGAEGDKLVVHNGESLAGLGGVRQVAGEIVVHRHPAPRKHTEDGKADVNQVKCLALIHNKSSDPFYGTLLLGGLCWLAVQAERSFQIYTLEWR